MKMKVSNIKSEQLFLKDKFLIDITCVLDGVSIDINPLDELCAYGEYVDPSMMYILNGA